MARRGVCNERTIPVTESLLVEMVTKCLLYDLEHNNESVEEIILQELNNLATKPQQVKSSRIQLELEI